MEWEFSQELLCPPTAAVFHRGIKVELYLQERPGARVTYQPGAIQQEGLKERKRQGEAVGICLGKEKVFLLGLHLGDTRSLCLSQQ